MRARGLLIALVLLAAGIAPAEARDRAVVVIGTGGITGVYYPAGGAICRLVNAGRRDHNLRCLIESTDGSIHNLQRLRAGEIHFAMAQSDWHYQALNGEGPFAGESPFTGLRSVMSLYAEPVTLVARAGTGIRRLADLPGKPISLGRRGSGERATMEVLFDRLGWSFSDFPRVQSFGPSELTDALCNGRTDAIVYAAGHPNSSIYSLTSACDAELVPIEGQAVSSLIAERPYYAEAVIPGGLYKSNIRDVPTFGVRATLVTREDVPEQLVYTMVRAVFEDFARFREMHPALLTLNPDQMVRSGLSAPLHDGAARYFREVGFLDANEAGAPTR